MLLATKKALVTGSSRGIGRKISELFLSEGAEVWGMCTHESKGKAELEELAASKGVRFHEFYADAGNAEQLTEAVQNALKESGGFDVLVNNAGITRDTLSFRMKKEDWDAVLAVNLTSAFLVCQIISHDMIRRKSGSIINMASIVGIHGGAGQVNYAASKGGLIAFSKSLAKETGSRGVRVNCIAPGVIKTDMNAHLSEQDYAALKEETPLGRIGTPQDIAGAMLFLASPAADFITGQVITADGGISI